ncbi:MAG: hypothetical protein GF317_18730 [Candidatus Lokiarchaeota archaeon]|nr:hypothetical protein [Candidatus Lokiarchaeota archaeon]MBD3201553.1 hypothetical protein [Candidatus Lokiarchaeota archaeon]
MNRCRVLSFGIIIALFLPFIASVSVRGEINSLKSYKATTAPIIDGSFTQSEWADAYHTSFYHTPGPLLNHPNDTIHVYIKNTPNKLYLLFDDLPDNTSDLNDYVYIYYDCNFDNQRDDNISMGLGRGSNGMIGDSMVNWAFGFGDSPNKIEDHTIIEIAINITFSSSYNGSARPDEMNHILPVGNSNGKIRIIFDASMHVSNWLIPQNGDIFDPTTYAELTLNAEPSANIPFGTPLLIGFILITAIISLGYIISRRKLKIT